MSEQFKIENNMDKENTHIFKCPECPKSYKYKTHLKDHHNNVHLGLRYPCSVCRKEFVKPSYVKKHMQNSHPGSKIENIVPTESKHSGQNGKKLESEFDGEPAMKKRKAVVIRFMKEEYYQDLEYLTGF